MEDHKKPDDQPDAEEPLSAEQPAELDEYVAAWDDWGKVDSVKATIAELNPKTERKLLLEQRAKLKVLMKRVVGCDYREPEPEFDPWEPLEGDKPSTAGAPTTADQVVPLEGDEPSRAETPNQSPGLGDATPTTTDQATIAELNPEADPKPEYEPLEWDEPPTAGAPTTTGDSARTEPAPETVAAAPAGTGGVAMGTEERPDRRGLHTNTIKTVFATMGNLYWDSKKWGDAFDKNRPDWLVECRVLSGRTGNSPIQATWEPFELACRLVEGRAGRNQKVPLPNMNRVFTTRAELDPWREKWSRYYEERKALTS